MQVAVDLERPDDAEAVRGVVVAAFTEQPAVADMVELIRASPRYLPDLALVARAEGRVVGFVMASQADLVGDDGAVHEVLTLSPLGVAPDHQRAGVGSALVRAVLAAADRAGHGLVTLEGDPRYYGRLGFSYAPDAGVTIELPDWAPREAAQVYRLSAYDPAVRGVLRYPPAFDVA